MRNTKAIFIKQIQSMIKSPTLIGTGIVLALAILGFGILLPAERDCDVCIPAYVCETCLLENPIHSLPTPSIPGMFTVMFVGMMMISSASALVQEDKTTHNLRFMTMSGMKPSEYLLGTASAIFVVSVPLLLLFSIVGGHFGMNMLLFMGLTITGAINSILLGIAIGLSKFPIFAGPASMVFGMGPMFSSFNESLARWLHFTYTQQVNLGIYHIGDNISRNLLIIGANGLLILLAFVWMHRKGELRW